MAEIDRSKIGKRNKSRSKIYENQTAAKLGGKRFLADTGGPVDVDHDWLSIQVKSRVHAISKDLKEGLKSAQMGAVGKKKLPCLVIVDRGDAQLGWYIMFNLQEWADWNGIVPN